MILPSQAQINLLKAANPTDQVVVDAAEIDSSAFDLLLAFVNLKANEEAELALDLEDSKVTGSQSTDSNNVLIPDRPVFAAKVAEWMSSNPAILAIVNNPAFGSTQDVVPGGLEVLRSGLDGVVNTAGTPFEIDVSNLNSQPIRELLTKFGFSGGTREVADHGVVLASAAERTGAGKPVVVAPVKSIDAGPDSGLRLANVFGAVQSGELDHDSAGAALRGAPVSAVELPNDSKPVVAPPVKAIDVDSGLDVEKAPRLSPLKIDSRLNGSRDDLLRIVRSQGFEGVGSSFRQVDPLGTKQVMSDFTGLEHKDQQPSLDSSTEFIAPPSDLKGAAKSSPGLSPDEQMKLQQQQNQADILPSAGLVSTGVTDSSRSFEGLQQAIPVQNAGGVLAFDSNTLEGTVSWLACQQGGSATIDLSPPELGSLRLELKIDAAGESAVLIVHAANEAAKAAIEQSLDRMYESFQSSGMALQVSVGSGSSQFAGMFSNGFEDRSMQIQGLNRSPEDARVGAIATTSRAAGVATDALSLYA